MLTRGVIPPSLPSLGRPPLWYAFTTFRHVADWRVPDWLTNTAGGRLFQLVVVVARRKKTTPHIETTNGRDPLKRDQHT